MPVWHCVSIIRQLRPSVQFHLPCKSIGTGLQPQLPPTSTSECPIKSFAWGPGKRLACANIDTGPSQHMHSKWVRWAFRFGPLRSASRSKPSWHWCPTGSSDSNKDAHLQDWYPGILDSLKRNGGPGHRVRNVPIRAIQCGRCRGVVKKFMPRAVKMRFFASRRRRAQIEQTARKHILT
jgi:hypothetical protein